MSAPAAPPPAPPEDAPHHPPAPVPVTPTHSDLLRVFAGVAMVGIGGGLPAHMRRAALGRAWMTELDFAETYTLAQLTPGPNAVNLAAMIGARLRGWTGALWAVVGVLTPGLIAMLAVTVVTLGLPGGLPAPYRVRCVARPARPWRSCSRRPCRSCGSWAACAAGGCWPW
ncbi:chromate transporter [Deinococcus aquaticus]|uniref:chromate transporter n=1 Tax=Deinococcus aquaticus TaxID=328692 RepID=UPI0036173A7D